jgi:hypothetical protein
MNGRMKRMNEDEQQQQQKRWPAKQIHRVQLILRGDPRLVFIYVFSIPGDRDAV